MEETETIPERPIFTHVSRSAELKPYPGALRTRQYRMVAKSAQPELYNMSNDPAETKNLAEAQPELLKALHSEYLAWFKDATSSGITDPAIPVGYAEAPSVQLPAHEAAISGGINYKRNPNGWAHDWIINWKKSSDQMEWNIEVVRPGRYEVLIQYTASEANLGSEVQVVLENQTIKNSINKAFTPVISENLDRVAGRLEALDQTWAYLSIGQVNLEPGNTKVSLSAPKIVGEQVGECKGLIINWLGNKIN